MGSYKKKVFVLFYSEKEDTKEAARQIRELCLQLGDRFEGVVKVEDMNGKVEWQSKF